LEQDNLDLKAELEDLRFELEDKDGQIELLKFDLRSRESELMGCRRDLEHLLEGDDRDNVTQAALRKANVRLHKNECERCEHLPGTSWGTSLGYDSVRSSALS
jgi:hypothetical protein